MPDHSLKNNLARFKYNKTGLQPISRPVEQILGFFPKGFKKESFSKNLKMVQKSSFIKCSAFGAAKPVSKPLVT